MLNVKRWTLNIDTLKLNVRLIVIERVLWFIFPSQHEFNRSRFFTLSTIPLLLSSFCFFNNLSPLLTWYEKQPAQSDFSLIPIYSDPANRPNFWIFRKFVLPGLHWQDLSILIKCEFKQREKKKKKTFFRWYQIICCYSITFVIEIFKFDCVITN